MEAAMFHIDFDNIEPQVLCHAGQEKLIPQILDGLKNYDLRHHFILFSSGTTGGDLKGYAISKAALFTNADAVNKHFGLTRNDVWGLSLPTYHVGGLSVLARAELLGNKIIDARSWNPKSWIDKMQEVTITTVVPTQLYDLVKPQIKAPKNLRYLVVGGDFLSSGLKEKAMELGWPVIRTFGMSEVCSQLASTKIPASDELQLLPIHQIKTDAEDRLLVKSEALFTLKFTLGEKFQVSMAHDLCDTEGFYQTQDRIKLTDSGLTHLGRMGEEIKIAGHLTDFASLKDILQNYLLEAGLFGKMELSLEDDERKGKRLVLLGINEFLKQEHIEQISRLLHPVKIDDIRSVTDFARTALGKLKSDQKT